MKKDARTIATDKRVYVLHGDVEQLDYRIVGVFESELQALETREKLNQEDSEVCQEIKNEFDDWDGWLITPFNLNTPA